MRLNFFSVLIHPPILGNLEILARQFPVKEDAYLPLSTLYSLDFQLFDSLVFMVGVSPSFTTPPSDITVTDGTSAVFTCEISGAPKPAIVWRKGTLDYIHTPLHIIYTVTR